MGIVSYLYSGTRCAENIRSVLVVLGVQKLYNIFIMKKLNAHPTKEMFQAREYYTAHAKRIERIKNILADEESKTVFTKLIHMRQYYDTKDIPPYNHFNQYFPKDIISFSDAEVFVDCGAFNGYTSIEFIKRCPSYKRVVAFEPQLNMLSILKKRTRKYKHIALIPKGCSDGEYKAYLSLAGESSTVTRTDNRQQTTDNRQQTTASAKLL